MISFYRITFLLALVMTILAFSLIGWGRESFLRRSVAPRNVG
jgi:hypothetical protein